MLSNPLLRKLVQISEEALPPVHGNDVFILTQQDVRITEESRFFIMSKVLPNGDLKKINSLDAANCLQQLSERENSSQYQQVFISLLEFLNYKRNASQTHQQVVTSQQPQQNFSFNENSYPQPMEVSVSVPEANVSTISQQLEWDKSHNSSAPFPIHYSQGTSTTDIDCQKKMDDRFSMTCNRCKTCCSHCGNHLRSFDKSTYTQVCNENPNELLDAREQLKKKKISYSLT